MSDEINAIQSKVFLIEQGLDIIRDECKLLMDKYGQNEVTQMIYSLMVISGLKGAGTIPFVSKDNKLRLIYFWDGQPVGGFYNDHFRDATKKAGE